MIEYMDNRNQMNIEYGIHTRYLHHYFAYGDQTREA